MKLGPQLHRIGNDIVAVYLIVTDDGVTVIDAGLSGQWPELISELDGLGRTVRDIRGIVLTHGDSDHLGFAERLRRDHGVPVFVHAADAARARGEIKPKTKWGKIKVGALARFLWYASRTGGLKTTYVRDVVTIEDGQVLDLPGAPRIIELPGHSPGSVAIHSAAADAVFVGDALTTRSVLTGENGPQPAPFTDDPAQAAASLARIAELDVTWVLPGHGAPWNAGAAAIVRRIEEFRAQNPA
ncbi:MBL fold metallo-hydrolase [Actinoplanes sp. NPDC023936]|uniref:MBL fold metallo-hydrolase n=1 Tax=Actinoplanes sp. NPDC023936 TaxID=3154910 RepID=UPI0033FF73CA